MDHGKVDFKGIRQRRDPLGATGVFGNHDGILGVIGDILADPARQQGSRVQVINGFGEKPLHLGGVQIHGDDMVGTSHGQKVGQHARGDGTTVLLHLGLLGVGKAGDHGGDLVGRATAAARDKDEQLHNMIID